MDRMTKLREAIRELVEWKFSGYLKINFSQGSLGRVEKFEEFEDPTVIVQEENTVPVMFDRRKGDRRAGKSVTAVSNVQQTN